MGTNIPSHILSLQGQRVNQIQVKPDQQKVTIHCSRDRRRKAIDPVTGRRGRINQYLRRQVSDLPLFGYPCVIDIELAQVGISKNERRLEHCGFVDKGCRYTNRFCRLVSELCRHMSIQAVSRHLNVRWETVKNMDRHVLETTLPSLDASQLTGLTMIGVDEVARAKGHDYMTVIYDMVEGHLTLLGFLLALHIQSVTYNMQGMKRQYQHLITEYLDYFPCVVLLGARQTGKSTLLQRFSTKRDFFDLEVRADYSQIATDPDLFFRLNDKPLAIDEAQILPSLFPALRVAIDKDRSTNGKYLLTGSSSPELLKSISESLAGRIGIIELAPFSFSETQTIGSPNLLTLFKPGFSANTFADKFPPQNLDNEISDYWFRGGYPEPWLINQPRFQDVWMEQYFKTYIEKDIARLFPNLNAVRFRRFIEILVNYSGSIINYSNIAKILDVSQPTVKDYFRIASGTFLWRNLPAYTKNTTKRIVKHPRGYFCDSGLLHHILQIPTHRRLLSHPQMGSSWEGMVIEEVLRTLNAAGIGYSAYYYRTSAGAEVDLVLEGKFGLIPIEIKHTQTVLSRHTRAIKDFISEFDCNFGVIINNAEKGRLYDKNLIGIPFASLVS